VTEFALGCLTVIISGIDNDLVGVNNSTSGCHDDVVVIFSSE